MRAKDLLAFRAKAFQYIRSYFQRYDFIEVETPVLVSCPGAEAYLQYFQSSWQDVRRREHCLYLRSSPELYMKQMLGMGMERIFELGKCFRNGGEFSAWHNPEFTMLEWYQAHISFAQMIDFTTGLIAEMYAQLGKKKINTWHKMTVQEAFAEFVGIELFDEDSELAAKALAKGYEVGANDDFATCFFKLMLTLVEPQFKMLGNVVLYDYPPSQAALAVIEDGVAKRFEVYLSGIEICNSFLECLDYEENCRRWQAMTSKRSAAGLPPLPPADDFLSALQQTLPSYCGNALGVDRLLALLLGAKDLQETILFRQQFDARN